MDDLHEWRRPDLYRNRPSPMVIEIVLDATQVSQNQALAIVDDNGGRREVPEAASGSAGRVSSRNGKKNYGEVVLERWTIELGSPDGLTSAELGESLPNVYKKGIITFRSLYTFLRFLPAYKLYRKLGRQPGGQQALRIKFRTRKGSGFTQQQPLPPPRQQQTHPDSLYTPLSPAEHASGEVVTHRSLDSLLSPAGPLSATVAFRHNCSFGIVEVDTLLSSLLLHQDLASIQTVGGRSLPDERPRPQQAHSSTGADSRTKAHNQRERPRGLLGAYGSLNTFHGTEKRQSPVSELRQYALEVEEGDDMDRLNELRDPASGKMRPAFKNGKLHMIPTPPIHAVRIPIFLPRSSTNIAGAHILYIMHVTTSPKQYAI